MDEMNGLTSKINEYTNLLEQLGDIDAKRTAGVLVEEDYIEAKARKFAYLAALGRLTSGELVDDEAFEAILADMREVAAQPTPEEVNAADIAYLMMLEGEE